jgi:hypothetical protein
METDRTNMPFEVKDCTLITRMGGVPSAINRRELRERLAMCPLACLFHHFCETVIRPSFDDPEFRNDLAVWSARQLRDPVLAERLGAINPYNYDNLEALREHLIEVLDDRLAEVPYYSHTPAFEEFRFMRAMTAVFRTGMILEKPDDLVANISQFSYSSIYYHFVEARRRTDRGDDDFSAWLGDFGNGAEPILEALRNLDFYYLTLPELKRALVDALNAAWSEVPHG